MDWIKALNEKKNSICVENHTDKTDRPANPNTFLRQTDEEFSVCVENHTDKTDKTLSAEDRYRMEERAAIMEFDAGLKYRLIQKEIDNEQNIPRTIF